MAGAEPGLADLPPQPAAARLEFLLRSLGGRRILGRYGFAPSQDPGHDALRTRPARPGHVRGPQADRDGLRQLAVADPYNQLPAITFWLLGTLSAAPRGDILADVLQASHTAQKRRSRPVTHLQTAGPGNLSHRAGLRGGRIPLRIRRDLLKG